MLLDYQAPILIAEGANTMLERRIPQMGPFAYPSGLRDKDKGEVKFGPPSSDYPTLLLTNPLYDYNQNIVPAGYYELKLDSEKTFLYLMQSGQTFAKIPVFKVEEDKKQLQQAPMTSKELRKQTKEQKKAEKKRKKLIKQGKAEDDKSIYNNATIEYDVKGDYYLIKYERGGIRAWGAIKYQ